MFGSNKKPLTRDDAKQLYQDLKSSMEILKARKAAGVQSSSGNRVSDETAKQIAKEIKAALKSDKSYKEPIETPRRDTKPFTSSMSSMSQTPPSMTMTSAPKKDRGAFYAISLVGLFAIAKMAFSILDYSGIFTVQKAEASYVPAVHHEQGMGQQYTKQELQILTSLDARRAELEAKNQQIDEKEKELDKRDREYATQMAELRDISSKLKADREKTEKKQGVQLAQLANIYNSMNPTEAAQLLDQLDVTTALSLVEKMSEKRIGQILPLMNAERALSITKLLSGKK